MPRSQLKRLYHLAIVVALLVGFAVGYSLKGPGPGAGVVRALWRSGRRPASTRCAET